MKGRLTIGDTTMGYRIELYAGQHPSRGPCETAYAETERDARRIVNKALDAYLRGE